MNDNYLPRIADETLSDMLKIFKAVYIAGPKWCGKTWTAKRQAKSSLYMQNPDSFAHNMKTADTKPSLLLLGDKPRLLDEWQVAPQLWDAVRFDVDQTGDRGQYILTGSATVKDGSTMHTGAGRIARMVMRPMSLFESKESSGQISLKSLFESEQDIAGVSDLTIEKLAYVIARGGWPEAVLTAGEDALRQVYQYIDVITHADVSKVDNVQRNPDRILALMRSLARNVSTQASASTIRADMRAGEEAISENTIAGYLNALSKIFVTEDLTAWNPSLRSKSAVRTSPTRHFVDPSIAAAALNVNHDGLLKDFNTFGLLFESLCVRDLRIYADSIDGNVFHYRDSNDLETDAVVQLRDGRWGGIECKMGFKEVEEAAAHLLKLKKVVNTEKMNEPSFLMVLTASNYAYRRPDGIYIVPIGCLKN
jgi:predicted AAA+ superfamily ATPase